MRELDEIEAVIYNDGERLIPGVTHDRAEEVRHRSSYVFWRTIVELDLERGAAGDPIRIADLGCGVGHGCVTLSELPNAHVVGVDSSSESLAYAARHYARDNIEYVHADLRTYIPDMPEFDYVVSRGSIEHVPDGIDLVLRARWRVRLMFDVPYAEPPATNPHHVITDVREDAFDVFPNRELFFQDLAGISYDQRTKPERPNMIICVASRGGLRRVTPAFRFPIPAWGGGAGPRRQRGLRAAFERLRTT